MTCFISNGSRPRNSKRGHRARLRTRQRPPADLAAGEFADTDAAAAVRVRPFVHARRLTLSLARSLAILAALCVTVVTASYGRTEGRGRGDL